MRSFLALSHTSKLQKFQSRAEMSGPVVCVLIPTDGNPSEISVACDGVGDGLPDGLRKHYVTPEPWEALPLLRAGSGSGSVFAYFQGVDRASEVPVEPNLKATILAMACGLHGTRLVGDVVVGRVLMGEGEGKKLRGANATSCEYDNCGRNESP